MLGCPICQDGICENPSDDNYPWVLSCGHIYHKRCIDRSLNINNNCPQCRKPVSRSFRLFPEELDKDETVTSLQDCVQSAEKQYERMKQLSDEKDNLIQELQSVNEDAETANRLLRTSNVNYIKETAKIIDKLNTDIKKLQEEKKRLNSELSKSVLLVAKHASTISDLQASLRVEKELSKAACQNKLETDQRLNQQIQILYKQKEDAYSAVRARDVEISQLWAKVNENQAQLVRPKEETVHLSDEEEPMPRQPDLEVENLTRDLEMIALPSRKRRSGINSLETAEETSVKQQKSKQEQEKEASPQDGGTSETATPSAPQAVATSSQPESCTSQPTERLPQTKGPRRYCVRKAYTRVKIEGTQDYVNRKICKFVRFKDGEGLNKVDDQTSD